MAQIKPLAAVVFNQEKIKDLSAVVCPPYDVISAKQQQYYYDQDEHNFIRIILNKDINGQDKYVNAANDFQSWLKDKILVQENTPGIYFYSHTYWIKRVKKTRLGFIALLRLEDRKSDVHGHEHTRIEAKEDRLRLLRQVKANLSPIFVIFSDKKRLIAHLWQRHIPNLPVHSQVTDPDRGVHKLWKIEDPKMLEKITSIMQKEQMFIADGHHRYEVSCAYREEMKKKLKSITGEEGFNYTLAYFTNNDPIGLTIMPIHRLVKLSAAVDISILIKKLSDYFSVEEQKDADRFFFLLEKAGTVEHVIGMHADRRYWLLRLKNIKVLDKLMADKPAEYRRLDVSILNSLVLKNTLGLDLEDKSTVSFIPEKEELLSKVKADPAYMAFFLNPTKMEQIMAVALKGEKMPAKSTYFYPKVISGLVINKHE